MELTIRKLTPDLLGDYLHFFETDAHADNPDEDRCYCVCWCREDHTLPTDFSSPEKRRALAVDYVNRGSIQGYLAYIGDRVVGWCNANDKLPCLQSLSCLRCGGNLGQAEPTLKIKSVFCFTVSPDFRRMGVATKLLTRVCEDAAAEGYDFVEAYPPREFISVFSDFMGPYKLYEKLGFSIHHMNENGSCIVRKYLK
ncbi:MAG: GNAT family N-acetyltransferase [Clostridia bacterium]|nr:GNAT family N-acetyltransferase [Clostridia bacterium]